MHKLSASSFHRHRSHQPVYILTLVGRRARSTQPLERGASTMILSIE
jgi:hypothetical protein